MKSPPLITTSTLVPWIWGLGIRGLTFRSRISLIKKYFREKRLSLFVRFPITCVDNFTILDAERCRAEDSDCLDAATFCAKSSRKTANPDDCLQILLHISERTTGRWLDCLHSMSASFLSECKFKRLSPPLRYLVEDCSQIQTFSNILWKYPCQTRVCHRNKAYFERDWLF